MVRSLAVALCLTCAFSGGCRNRRAADQAARDSFCAHFQILFDALGDSDLTITDARRAFEKLSDEFEGDAVAFSEADDSVNAERARDLSGAVAHLSQFYAAGSYNVGVLDQELGAALDAVPEDLCYVFTSPTPSPGRM